jgi:hypothetical protein
LEKRDIRSNLPNRLIRGAAKNGAENINFVIGFIKISSDSASYKSMLQQR